MDATNLDIFHTAVEPGKIRHVVKEIYGKQHDAPDLMAIFIQITGDVTSAYMLDQVLHWGCAMQRKNKSWWYKSKASWQQQAGLTRSQVQRCEGVLERLGIIARRVQTTADWPSPVTHYRVNWAVFWYRFGMAVRKTFDDLARLLHSILSPINMQESDQSTRDSATNQPVEESPIESRESRESASITTTGDSSGSLQPEAAAESAAAANDTAHVQLNKTPENNLEEDHAHSGDHPAPPPVPRGPLPTGVVVTYEQVRAHPYWQAFCRAWNGADPDFPVMASPAYAGVIDQLRALGATSEEVEACTRWKIAKKREQRGRGKDSGPYRFVYLAVDLYEWREMQKGGVEGHEAYTSGVYAPYIQTGMVAG